MNPHVAEFLPPDQEILQEVLVYFLGEVGEHLSTLRQGLQEFCQGESERLLDLHHSVHTLKGSSSTVGLVLFSSYVRRLESALHAFKEPNLQPTTMLENHLLAALDCLQMQIDAIQRDSCENLDLQLTANCVFEHLESHLRNYAKDDSRQVVLIRDVQDRQRNQILQVMDQIRTNNSQIRRLNHQLKQLYNRLLSGNLEVDDPVLSFQGSDAPTGKHFNNIQEMVAYLNVQVSGVSQLVEKAKENMSFLSKNIDSLRKPTRRMQLPQEGKIHSNSSPNILIVDDSAALRHMLVLSLHRMGFHGVEVACDGQEALAMLQRDNYRLVISDIEMPRLNGIELLSQMQSSTRLAKIPLIFLTSCAGEQYRQLATEMGACGYLNKPHRESDLRRAIDTAIGQEISA
jgi:CheY-like chemotaxis protein/HPt (histidine-containing phosphotransfer) domain-containing protein